MTNTVSPRIFRPLQFRGPYNLAPPAAPPWSHRSHPYKFGRLPVVVPKGRLIDTLGTGLIYMDSDIASPVHNAHTLSRISAMAGYNLFRVPSFRAVAPIHDTMLDPTWPLWTAGPDAIAAQSSTAGQTGSSSSSAATDTVSIGGATFSGSTLAFVAVAAVIGLWLMK